MKRKESEREKVETFKKLGESKRLVMDARES